ncbi:MAG: FkbM family methyltransferase [Bacteroidales bacterium]|jgi:FkbM family methyltransferase|nr:FkbM family methyltransferase [Bacteroidales bacterium]
MRLLKKWIFRLTSLENYLRILQWGFFFLYRTGWLKRDARYACYYYVKRLIRPGDVIVDIGANLGYYSFLFARWTGSSGKVLSVEPVAVYNRIFREKGKKYPNVVLYPCALGREEGPVELVSSPATGRLHTGLPHIYDPQTDGLIEKQEFRFEAEMKIPSSLFSGLERMDYLKCDVEGFEYVILSEMKDLLRRFKPKVQVEVWDKNRVSIMALFTELGYTPYKIDKNRLVAQTDCGDTLAGDYIFLPG